MSSRTRIIAREIAPVDTGHVINHLFLFSRLTSAHGGKNDLATYGGAQKNSTYEVQ